MFVTLVVLFTGEKSIIFLSLSFYKFKIRKANNAIGFYKDVVSLTILNYFK